MLRAMHVGRSTKMLEKQVPCGEMKSSKFVLTDTALLYAFGS